MSFDFSAVDWAAQLSILVQVLMIDLVLAGDNAVAVGLAAGGLERRQRRRVIWLGLVAAVVLRIGFALIAIQLLAIIGLLLAGGLLLLWVCWKMWRDLRARESQSDGHLHAARPAKTFAQAFLQILIADVSMSLDNVLAVAGAARDHPVMLVFGLLLSIALMGVAATWIAKLLGRFRWIGYLGLLIVLYVAGHMVWQGHRQVVIDLNRTAEYNAHVPAVLAIRPEEVARHKAHRD